MNDLLNTENLIDLHEKLNKFAEHHKNRGGQEAHKLIKRELIDKVKSEIRDGSFGGMRINEGYDRALKQVLELLRNTFIK